MSPRFERGDQQYKVPDQTGTYQTPEGTIHVDMSGIDPRNLVQRLRVTQTGGPTREVHLNARTGEGSYRRSTSEQPTQVSLNGPVREPERNWRRVKGQDPKTGKTRSIGWGLR